MAWATRQSGGEKCQKGKKKVPAPELGEVHSRKGGLRGEKFGERKGGGITAKRDQTTT